MPCLCPSQLISISCDLVVAEGEQPPAPPIYGLNHCNYVTVCIDQPVSSQQLELPTTDAPAPPPGGQTPPDTGNDQGGDGGGGDGAVPGEDGTADGVEGDPTATDDQVPPATATTPPPKGGGGGGASPAVPTAPEDTVLEEERGPKQRFGRGRLPGSGPSSYGTGTSPSHPYHQRVRPVRNTTMPPTETFKEGEEEGYLTPPSDSAIPNPQQRPPGRWTTTRPWN